MRHYYSIFPIDPAKSAQLLRIRMRGSMCAEIGPRLDNFLFTHVSYVHPEFVLEKTNISLMSATSKTAIFTMNPLGTDLNNFAR